MITHMTTVFVDDAKPKRVAVHKTDSALILTVNLTDDSEVNYTALRGTISSLREWLALIGLAVSEVETRLLAAAADGDIPVEQIDLSENAFALLGRLG